ncbi:hypothetical protein [Bradyrhizobium sp. NP1]|uniref:hypothetical protein n=1 Tax=Bradyrhizobium sp. NP1 TaxID=3049772 RepID=UPI0025A59266|nr:hypothetical protein [Bradyrhizobium sp. NP1]WJR81153.1 hypothetical protein QOU61_15770 [Bradyrhizobium sp. NP1]
MFKNVSAIALTSAVLIATAHAGPLEDALNIQKTKNPLGTLMRNNHACNLISPPTPLLLNDTQAGTATPGNITIAKFAADGTTYDLRSLGDMCPTPIVTDKFPVRVNNLNSSITTSIAYKDDITASLKLTLGSWLKLIDFDASNIEEVGIWITTAESPAFNPDMNRSAAALKKKDQSCTVATQSPKQASIIDRACVGKITISLVAKKDMSLNAFDLQFAKLTVGLKASWIRDISGAASDCTVDASGIATGAAPAGGGGGATADKVPTSDGTLVDITAGNVDLQFKSPSSNVVTKPTPGQVAGVSKPATPPASPGAKPANPTTDKPADQAGSKPAQPAAQDKVCAKNVVYQTNGLMVVGVDMIKAASFLNNN